MERGSKIILLINSVVLYVFIKSFELVNKLYYVVSRVPDIIECISQLHHI